MADAPLHPDHRAHLHGSAISDEIINERKYQTVSRTPNDNRGRDRLKECGIPGWARRDEARYPGILIPLYRATGEHISWQYRPDRPPKDPDTGKVRKYAAQGGRASVIDVHPRNKDHVVDPTVPLWLTEGVKKGDALTTAGACAVTLSGVFNWRSRLGTLGDWEDIPLKGRDVYVCFDADATTNMNVARAMVRLGKWLKSKGTKKVTYVIVPAEVEGAKVKGADDYLAAGGTLADLREVGSTVPPNTATTNDTFTDARMAETVAEEVLDGHHVWCKGLGWLSWDGAKWAQVSDEAVGEPVRQWVLDRFSEAIAGLRDPGGQPDNANSIDGWRSMLGLGRIRGVLTLAKGIVERQADDFDADPELLNTPAGIVNLTTGTLAPHDPEQYMTKVTRGSYLPGHTHPDWTKALEALDKPERDWLQDRIGQATTGHTTPDGIMPVLQGGGENGKSAIIGTGVIRALGEYASAASPKLFLSTKGSEHSTEMADLRGQRLMVAEEVAEGRAIDVTALKRIQDVETIKARYVHKDNMTFTTSHSLFCTTNYIPVINETDHGTWRRLVLVVFPYRFRKPSEELEGPNDRHGDPDLKSRMKADQGVADAVVTWAVEGAARVAAEPAAFHGRVTPKIQADTRAWRIEADRVLGFWTERLIRDRGACILAKDMLDAFNDWVESNGHNGWSKEMFGSRFKVHQETTRNGVEHRVTAALQGLDLYVRETKGRWDETPPVSRVPKQARVWFGVRFRVSSDTDETILVDEVDNPLGTSLSYSPVEKVPEPSSTSSTSQVRADSGQVPHQGNGAPKAPTVPADEAARLCGCGNPIDTAAHPHRLLCDSCAAALQEATP